MEHSVFATIILPIALAVIMVSLGTYLTTDDFRRVVVYPKGAVIGLANLLVLSPLLAFAVAEAYNLSRRWPSASSSSGHLQAGRWRIC